MPFDKFRANGNDLNGSSYDGKYLNSVGIGTYFITCTKLLKSSVHNRQPGSGGMM